MNNSTQILLDLKDQNKEDTFKLKKIEGQIEELEKNLKTEFKCEDLKTAQSKLKEEQIKIDKDKDYLNKQIVKLEEKYNW